MKIFISWSGEGSQSHKLAIFLKDWFPDVIQSIEPYVSTEDIEKGEKWFNNISSELKTSDFGIICVTKENIDSPWLHFETGALTNTFGNSHICPLLINFSVEELKGPLCQFQVTESSYEDFFKLLKTLNQYIKPTPLSDNRLKKLFETFWPSLETKLKELKNIDKDNSKLKNEELKKGDDAEIIVSMIKEVFLELNKKIAFLNKKINEIKQDVKTILSNSIPDTESEFEEQPPEQPEPPKILPEDLFINPPPELEPTEPLEQPIPPKSLIKDTFKYPLKFEPSEQPEPPPKILPEDLFINPPPELEPTEPLERPIPPKSLIKDTFKYPLKFEPSERPKPPIPPTNLISKIFNPPPELEPTEPPKSQKPIRIRTPK